MFKPILYTLLFFFILCPCLYAQRIAQGETLSLNEALSIAYKQGPLMAEARREEQAQRGRFIQKRMLPDPQAEVSIGGLKESGFKEENLDSYKIMQPVGSLSERLTSLFVAHDEVQIVRNQTKMIWAETRLKIIKLYTDIMTKEKALEFSQDNLNSTRQLFAAVENRLHSGNALQSELTRSRIEVLQAENDVLTKEKDLKSAKGELNLNLGRQPESSLVLSDFLDEEPMVYQYQGLVEKAMLLRPDLKSEQARLRIQRLNYTNTFSQVLFPEMAVGFERTMKEYENDSAIIFEFTYPLWSFWGKTKEAGAEYDKQKIKLNTFRKQVHLDVYQAFLDAELAQRQINIQKNALDEANELLRQASIQYEAGEMPFINYLDNIKTIKETRLNYLMALGNYKQKLAALDLAVGNVYIPQGVKE